MVKLAWKQKLAKNSKSNFEKKVYKDTEKKYGHMVSLTAVTPNGRIYRRRNHHYRRF